MIRKLIIILIFGLGIVSAQPHSIEAIKDSVISRFEQIEDYRVDIKVAVKMTGFRMPRKKIRMFYKKPDKMKIEADGFAIIPKTGVAGNPSEFLNMLESVSEINPITLDNNNQWKISGSVKPDSLKIPLGLGKDEVPDISMDLFIDADDWVINQVAVFVDTQKVFIINTDYEIVDGFVLPRQTEFKLGLKGISQWTTRNPFGGPEGDRHDFDSIAKSAGYDSEKDEFAGKITMTFSKYRVNKGLKDRIFRE